MSTASPNHAEAVPGDPPGCPFDPASVESSFDIYDPTISQNLDAILHHIRAKTPVARSSANGGYVLAAAYDDVVTVLSDDATFSSTGGKSIPSRQMIEMPPLDVDPPEHRDYRRLLNRFFSKAGLAKHEPAIRDLARLLIDGFVDRGEVEILQDYASALTGATLCRVILNLDDDELQRQAQERVTEIGKSNSPEAWKELTSFIGELLEQGHGADRDDVLGAVLTGTINDRPLTELEQLGVVVVLFIGGLDTTRAAITSIIRHVALDPHLEERLRTTDWTRSDLDEFLRLDSVVTGLARTVTRDTELGGVPVRAGEKVLVHYYAANHDPATFPDPDALAFDRGRNPHVAFGVGIHRCLGSNLARLQIRIAIEELLARVENIRVAEGADVTFAAGVARSPVQLRIVFDRR